MSCKTVRLTDSSTWGVGDLELRSKGVGFSNLGVRFGVGVWGLGRFWGWGWGWGLGLAAGRGGRMRWCP